MDPCSLLPPNQHHPQQLARTAASFELHSWTPPQTQSAFAHDVRNPSCIPKAAAPDPAIFDSEIRNRLRQNRKSKCYRSIRIVQTSCVGRLDSKRNRHLLVMFRAHIEAPQLHLSCSSFRNGPKVDRLLFMMLVSEVESPQLLSLCLRAVR